MGIKSMLQRWLGINQVRVVEPKYMISGGKPVQFFTDTNLHRAKFPEYSESPRSVKHFYKLCGGYEMFRRIMKHKAWYAINQRSNNARYPYVLIVFNRDCITAKGNPESRSLRAKSIEQAKDFALELVRLYDNDISRFS